jgi:hypothetical protein
MMLGSSSTMSPLNPASLRESSLSTDSILPARDPKMAYARAI